MGGWMPYDRVRHRNGLEWWPDEGAFSPYPPPDVVEAHKTRTQNWYLLVGDLNRMERDYLAPVYPQDEPARDGRILAHRERGSSPAEECARATGVDVETVRAVLAYVFHRGLRR